MREWSHRAEGRWSIQDKTAGDTGRCSMQSPNRTDRVDRGCKIPARVPHTFGAKRCLRPGENRGDSFLDYCELIGLGNVPSEPLAEAGLGRKNTRKPICSEVNRMLQTLKSKLRMLARNESGGEVLEYALIAGLIVVAAIAVIGSVGTKVLARWNSLNSKL